LIVGKVNTNIKRVFDIILSLVVLPILILPLIVLTLFSTLDTKEWGIFSQERIGKNARVFRIYKIRTLKNEPHFLGHLDKSATAFGKWMRKYKLDEIPQIINVLVGDMSFVGPRPDIKGFADELIGEDRIILKIRPGVTGPATIKYRDEEEVLGTQDDPEKYNRTIIWPDKVEINKKYIENWSFYLDLKFIIKSILN
jgi:lipopolysaccharide/colanic/teichoic acid biosynthesis glycosyltransferase